MRTPTNSSRSASATSWSASAGSVVLDHLSLDVRRGEILGLVGASGGGKSVLMRTIIGLIPRRAATIEVMGGRSARRDRTREPVGADGASCSSRARCSPR